MDSTSTLDHEAGGTKPRNKPRRVKITPGDDEDVPWSQIRELDDRIEAVARQRLHVQAALRRRRSYLSYRGMLYRARFLFGCGWTNDHKQLEDTLGWLKEKETELHDVKLSILREAAYRQRHSRSSPDSADGSRAKTNSAPAASAVTPSKYPRVRSKALVVHRTCLVKAVGTHCNAKGGNNKRAAVRRSSTAASADSTNDDDDAVVACKFHTATGSSAPDSPPVEKPQPVRRRVSFADDWQADKGDSMPTAKSSGTGGVRLDSSTDTASRVDVQLSSSRSSIFPEFSPSPPPDGHGFFGSGREGANIKAMGGGAGKEQSTRGSKAVMRGVSQRGGYLSREDSMVAGDAFGTAIPDPPTMTPPPPPQPQTQTRATRPSQRTPAGPKKDVTLRKMHDLLTNGLWDMDVEGKSADIGGPFGDGGAVGSTEGTARAVGEEQKEEEEEEEETPPSVWVSGYVDKLNNFGLGFLLSDGSVGVAFNSGITMVLQPTGKSFDHIKRARSSSRKTAAAGGNSARGRGEAGLVRTRHALKDVPHKLRKHVILLKDLRKYIHNVGEEEAEERGKGAPATEAEQEPLVGDEDRKDTMVAAQKEHEEPVPFVQQFFRTRWMVLFGLSNGTVQILFSDRSELLLLDEARLITYVSKHGKRETFTLRRVLREKRRAVIKRVRCCNRLIARALRGSN